MIANKQKDFFRKQETTATKHIFPNGLPRIPELTENQVCEETAAELHTPELSKNMGGRSTRVKEYIQF